MDDGAGRLPESRIWSEPDRMTPEPVLACPRCGSSSLARIFYGEPSADPALDADIRAGRIVLGGCVVGEREPEHRCRNCGAEFGNVNFGAAAEKPIQELFTTLLPAEPRPGSWRVGRLVLTGPAQSSKNPPDRRDLLAAAIDEIAAQKVHLRFLVTPAGFFKPTPPPGLELTHGWDTDQGDFDRVRDIAETSVTELLCSDSFERAQGHVDYLVVGADVHGLGHHAYAETALVYDVKAKELVGSTGKTYPNVSQQDRLVRNPDANSHVMHLGGEKVAVLVCHDLIAWSPRGAAARGSRRAGVAADLSDALVVGRPTTVLHLPHKTHSAQTWAPSWASIEALLPGTTWASAIRYRKGYSRPQVPLGFTLLDRTRSGSREVLDIVLGGHTSLDPGPSGRTVG